MQVRAEMQYVDKYSDYATWESLSPLNVYAKTRADCEILLAAMIEDVRAKIAAEKERLQSGSKE